MASDDVQNGLERSRYTGVCFFKDGHQRNYKFIHAPIHIKVGTRVFSLKNLVQIMRAALTLSNKRKAILFTVPPISMAGKIPLTNSSELEKDYNPLLKNRSKDIVYNH